MSILVLIAPCIKNIATALLRGLTLVNHGRHTFLLCFRDERLVPPLGGFECDSTTLGAMGACLLAVWPVGPGSAGVGSIGEAAFWST